MNISFVVIAPEENPIVLNSVASLSENTVYVQKNSIIEKYLTSLGGIDIKTYEELVQDTKKFREEIKVNKYELAERNLLYYGCVQHFCRCWSYFL